MAVVERWLRTANTSPALPVAVSAGGGSGTQGSPYATWTQLRSYIETVADHSADDLIVNVHPASVWGQGGSGTFASLSGWGRGTGAASWRSITFRTDPDVLAAAPGVWDDWRYSVDTLRYDATPGNWTQGSVSGGVWAPDGVGDVYRCTTQFVVQYASNDPWQIRVWYGRTLGDNTGQFAQAGVGCMPFDQLSEAGDYCLGLVSGTTHQVYVKTGTPGVDPVTKWGGVCFHLDDGAVGLAFSNSRGIVFEDAQLLGGAFNLSQAADGANEDFTFTRLRTRMQSIKGLYGTTGTTEAYIRRIKVVDPDMSASGHPTAEDKGPFSHEAGGNDGILFSNNIDDLEVINARVEHFSHGNIGVGSTDGRAITSLTRSGSTATATTTSSNTTTGATVGATVWVDCVEQPEYNGQKTVLSNPTPNSFTFAVDSGAASPANSVDGASTMTVSKSTRGVTQYPRNVRVYVTDYSGGRGVLTGRPGYQRSFGFACPVGSHFSGMRIRKSQTQAQFGRGGRFRSVHWHDDCVHYSDEYGSANWNVGNCASFQGGPWDALLPPTVPPAQFLGCVFDLAGGYAVYSGYYRVPDFKVRGCLIRDAGHDRYIPQASNTTDPNRPFYTRPKVAFLGTRNDGNQATSFDIVGNRFVLAPGCDGIAVSKAGAGTWNAHWTSSPSAWPVVAVSDSGTWGAGGLVGSNVAGTEAAFGRDDELNRTTAPRTPRASARPGRGY